MTPDDLRRVAVSMDEVAAQYDAKGSTGIIEAAWATSVREAADEIERLQGELDRGRELADRIAQDFADCRSQSGYQPGEPMWGWYGWVSADEVEELVSLIRSQRDDAS